jgi:hypothetical protein
VGIGTPLSEPELFYLPWARPGRGARPEPIEHAIPVGELTRVSVGIPALRGRSQPASSVEATGLVSFRPADAYFMSLVFDGGGSGRSVDLHPDLPLEVRW